MYSSTRREGIEMKWNRKYFVFCVCICVAFVLFGAFVGAGVASARTIYVPDDYAKIQWAVDAASASDTIIVRPGTYIENVDVDKSLEIRSYSQNPSDTIVKAFDSHDHVFYVTADNVYISGFTVTGATGYIAGIHLYNSNNCRIEKVDASNNYDGIYLKSSSNNIIANNTVSSNNYFGIYLYESSSNTITNNTVSSNYLDGIYLYKESNNNIIANNTVSDNRHGIHLKSSSNNCIANNTASSNNEDGIHLRYSSSNNIIANNTASSNNHIGICLYKSSSNNIIANNTVSSNNDDGIHILSSSNNIIANNTVSSNNDDGIFISDSSNNIIANNTVSSNKDYGIYLKYSRNNIMASNTVSNNDGIYLYYSSSNNIIANNIASNNDDGIYLYYSSSNTITNNTISSNYYNGIYLEEESNNNIIANNTVSSNKDYGIYLKYSRNNIIASDTVSNNENGTYLEFSCSNTIANNIVSANSGDGIHLKSSGSNTIANNTVSNSKYGICLGYSSNNTIANNNASNNDNGIYLKSSSKNFIYLNNFINNTDNVYSYYSTNIWNSTEKITYTYNGKQHTNYLGNYWSNYTGSDEDEDGIGDTPYSIDSDKDNYPLMEMSENYIVVTPVPNQQPIANFTYSPEKPVVNQSVTFDASPSYDPDGTIVSYEWDFGDGNITNTTEETINHSYSEVGSYEVTLTVTDDDGTTNSTTKVVGVQPAPDITPPAINFVSPTPANNSTLNQSYVEIKVSIEEPNLDTLIFNWNGTNYTIYDDSLVLHVNLDNNSAIGEDSSQVVDISKYGHIGAIYGAAYVEGKYGKALKFDGVNDYVTFGNKPEFQITKNITIAAWVKHNTGSPRSWEDIVMKGNTAYGFQFYSTQGYFTFHLTAAGGGWKNLPSNVKPLPSVWYHVVGTYDGKTQRIYINGVLNNEIKDTFTISTNSEPLTIGYKVAGDNSYLNGIVDDIQIYNRVLTPEEIKMLYHSTLWKHDATHWHFYANITNLSDGKYSYYVLATDTSGNRNVSETRVVTISLPTNKPPVANFTYSPENPVVGQVITFDASESYDPDGYIVSYEWDFGDGNVTSTTHEIIKHSYSESGSYKVTLTVKDDDGATNSTTKEITVPPGATISFNLSKSIIGVGSIAEINLIFDNAQNGLSGYNITVSLSNATVAEISSVSFPDWATIHSNSTLPADSLWIKAADLNDEIKSGAKNITLATITLRGDKQGESDILITVTKMDDDNGNPINPNTVSGHVEVIGVIPFPGCENPSTDPDRDGLYEDINGNGRKDFNDVVVFFNYLEWAERNQPCVKCFDFNKNSRIDFDDVVKLFEEI